MARFTPIIELVESLCLRSGDTQMRNKGLFLSCSKDVWNDLNETTLRLADRVKMPVRQRFHVDKRTNSINLPQNALRVSSVNVIGDGGVLYPVYRNERLHDDIVDVSVEPDCACEYKCGYQLCNSIKGYEVVKHTDDDYMPDGSPVSFDCVDRKVLLGNILYEQKQYPQRIYESGVWTDTIKHTENIKLCKLEVDHNGCVCDTDANVDAVCDACGFNDNDNDKCCVGGSASVPPAKDCNAWTYYCTSKMDWFAIQCGRYPFFRKGCENIYNISELGDRLIFPHNFGWDKVVVRYYADISLNNLMIPYIARQTFMTGLQCFANEMNVKKQGEANVFCNKYSRYKWGLFLELNKNRLAELRMMFTPPVYVPSYQRHNRFGNW